MSKLSAVQPRTADTPPPRGVRTAPPPGPDAEDQLEIGQLVGTVLEKRWLILAATLLLASASAVYAFTATPVFRADALVQVETKSSGLEGLAELTDMFSQTTPAEAEIELIRSRMVVSSVVDQLRLDVDVRPDYFPLVGGALARRNAARQWALAPPLFGLSSYAWGGERVQVQRLDVPKALENVPLTLVAGEAGRFTLSGPDGEPMLEGKVGEAAGKAPTAGTPQVAPEGVAIFVSELVARPGTHFKVRKLPFSAAVTKLQSDLRVLERGKKTGILQMTLDGPERGKVQAALDAVTQVYLRQNVERKSAEVEKTLQFVMGQLPELQQRLEAAETALKEYQKKNGSVDLGLEAEAVIKQSSAAEQRLTELELQYAELRQRFTESHPSLVGLRRQMEQLKAERLLSEDRMKKLPEAELGAARLQRDMKVSNELYILLLNKAQELRLIKSGTIGNVRIIDPATVQLEIVSPKRALIVLGGLLGGLMLGVSLAFATKALNRGLEDPALLEQEFGVSVYASVPHSKNQEVVSQRFSKRRQSTLTPLAVLDPADLAVESLRSLRTGLQFALTEARTNVIAIGGPRPGIGKSFISVNLAHVLADSGKRVLLVDADMRKGQLHNYFGLERVAGLSEVIRGTADIDSTLRPTQTASLSFMATGSVPPNPSELLASARFRNLVEELSSRFDFVLLDAPPILAVTDAALIAQAAGVNLMVLRSGLHPLREVAMATDRLRQTGVEVNGFVLNDVPLRTGAYAGGQYGYHYQYEYK
jgi:tyrosine-protein kinase Etk/Wzc